MKKTKVAAVFLSIVTALGCTFNVSALSDVQKSCPNYSEMKSQKLDLTEFDSALSRLDKISENPDKYTDDEVIKNAEILLDEFSEVYTLKTIHFLEYNNDVTNNTLYEQLSESETAYIRMNNDIGDCVADLCSAGFEEVLRDVSGYDMVASFSYIDSEYDYSEFDDENEQLLIEIEQLINKYMSYTEEDFSAEYNGKSWTTSDLLSEYYLSEGEIAEVALQINQKRNETLGNIYLELLQKRHQLALNNGYDNYAEYAYECLFARDYSYDETEEIYDFVKEHLSLLSTSTYDEALTELENSGLMDKQYSDGEVLNIASDFLSDLDISYLENFNHMRSHNLYTLDKSETGSGDAFTSALTCYSVPYMYISSCGDFTDISTVAHEFGHANAEYTLPSSAVWDLYGNSIDTCEIHSQGMEILFALHQNSEFTKDESMAYLKYTLSNMVYSIIQGCLFDEFQRYVYENPDCTLDELNKKYTDICKEYGIDYSPEDIYEFDWVEVVHNFDSPMYYISYATSAASALDLWLQAMESPEDAKETYKLLVENCDAYTPYKKAADFCGFATIFDKEAMTKIFYQIEHFFKYEEIDPDYSSDLILENSDNPEKTDSSMEFESIGEFLDFLSDSKFDFDNADISRNDIRKVILIVFVPLAVACGVWFTGLITAICIIRHSDKKKRRKRDEFKL